MNNYELSSIAEYIGTCPRAPALEKLFCDGEGCDSGYADCEKLEFSSDAFLSSSDMKELLYISDGISEEWKSGEVTLTFSLFLREGRIIGGHICKKKKISYDDGSRAEFETEPEIRDIDFVNTLLSYLIS